VHVDFYKINPGHKFRVAIPVELTGSAKGVKAGGALEHYIRQLKVMTTPEKIMEKIEVDITNLGVGEAIHLSQLNLPREWETRLTGDPVVCRVAQSRMTLKAAAENPPK
jgi:large subunit ribosomal protein L25